MKQCKRCKCRNYSKAVEHNAAGEVIRCSICSQDPMLLAQHAQDCFEEAREQMFVQSSCGKLAEPNGHEKKDKSRDPCCESRVVLDRDTQRGEPTDHRTTGIGDNG